MVPAVEAQSLNHWTTKEVPGFPLFNHSWPSSLPTGETWTRRVTCLPVALMSDRLAHPYSLKRLHCISSHHSYCIPRLSLLEVLLDVYPQSFLV